MNSEKDRSKPTPKKSPGEKESPFKRGAPKTYPRKEPQLEPPHSWPRKPKG